MKFLFVLCLLAPLSAAAGGPVIREVLFDPVGADTGLEWVAIDNAQDASLDLSGWELYPDGIGYFVFPAGFFLAANQSVIVHLRASGSASDHDVYHAAASANMGNTSGSIALFSGEPRGKGTIKSFVEWGRAGETWEADASGAGLWERGAFVDLGVFVEGDTIALKSVSAPAGKDAWAVAHQAANNAESSEATTTAGTNQSTTKAADNGLGETPAAAQSIIAALPVVGIYADAGSDREAVTGAAIEFLGSAFGLKKEPLDPARYWWNFGDGETHEGRGVLHAFAIPGRYIVGLHVSSGEYSASDYALVNVAPNKIRVVEVVEGIDGFVRMENPADIAVDIGGWILEDAPQHSFTIPVRTKIGAGAQIALSNGVTGLLQKYGAQVLSLRYPNASLISVFPISQKAGALFLDGARVATSSLVHREQTSSVATSNVSLRAGAGIAAAVGAESGARVLTNATRDFVGASDERIATSSENRAIAASALEPTSRAGAPGFFLFRAPLLIFLGALVLSALGALGWFFVRMRRG